MNDYKEQKLRSSSKPDILVVGTDVVFFFFFFFEVKIGKEQLKNHTKAILKKG